MLGAPVFASVVNRTQHMQLLGPFNVFRTAECIVAMGPGYFQEDLDTRTVGQGEHNDVANGHSIG